MNYGKEEEWALASQAIKLVDGLVSEGGEDEESIKTKREYSKTREAWIAAIYLIKRMNLENRPWYIRGNDTENSVDDIYALPLDISGPVPMSSGQISIQVVRETNHSPGDVLDTLKKKFEYDLSGVSLVCYVMKDESINWSEVCKSVRALNPKVNDVTIIGNLGGGRWVANQVYPDFLPGMVDLNESLTIPGPKMVRAQQVRNQEDAGMSNIGEALLTPQFKIINSP